MLERQREVVEEADDDGGEERQRRSSTPQQCHVSQGGQNTGTVAFWCEERDEQSQPWATLCRHAHPPKHVAQAHKYCPLSAGPPHCSAMFFFEASRDQQTGNTSLFLHPLSTDCSNLAWLHVNLKARGNWKSYKRLFFFFWLCFASYYGTLTSSLY